MLAQILLPALAFATAVAADCTFTSTVTITAAGDLQNLATCTAVSGDVVIQTGAASANAVNLGDIAKWSGSLLYENDNTTGTIQGTNLEEIDSLTLSGLTSLTNADFPALTTVNTILNFTNLNSLATLSFGSGLEKAGNIVIINTQISSLNGISSVQNATGLSIGNNPYLSNIELQVSDFSDAVVIGVNDQSNGGQTVNFPNLISAGQLTFQNSSQVMLPSLEYVDENIGFYGNTFESIACPNLTYAGGIVFVSNTALTNISMPMLTTLNGTNGTYLIANNTKLDSISGFQKLAVVTANLDFYGNFSSVMLPDLKAVGGALDVQTSSTTFDCSKINALGNGHQIVKGSVTCKSGESSTPDSGSGGSSTTGGSTSATSSGAAVPLSVPAWIGGTSVGAILLQFLLSF